MEAITFVASVSGLTVCYGLIMFSGLIRRSSEGNTVSRFVRRYTSMRVMAMLYGMGDFRALGQ